MTTTPPRSDKPKEDLIAQIMEFQGRYRFPGPQHSREDLQAKPMKWLEKMCTMQILGITLYHAPDRAMQSRESRIEHERAMQRMHAGIQRRSGLRPAGYLYDEYAQWEEVPDRSRTPLGVDGPDPHVRTVRRRMDPA